MCLVSLTDAAVFGVKVPQGRGQLAIRCVRRGRGSETAHGKADLHPGTWKNLRLMKFEAEMILGHI